MTTEYLFIETENELLKDIFIVSSVTKNDAINKVALFAIRDDFMFLEYVGSRSINMSFAETFFIQKEDEVFYFQEKGKTLIDDDEFIKRVQAYFGDNIKLANEYIDYYFSDNDSDILSDDLLVYIWNDQWNQYQTISIEGIKRL